MGALRSRFAASLMSQRARAPKRASLHSGTPPTEANRLTAAGFVYEVIGRGTSFWQVVDSTPGLAIGSDAATRLYTEVDFTVNGANPVVAPGTPYRIRALAIGYASRSAAEGESQEDLPYDYLAWSTLDQPWPAASKLLRFLEPGNPNRDDDFPAPYIRQPAVPLSGRGGQWTDRSQIGDEGGFNLFASSFFRLFVSRPMALLFNLRRAQRLNCDLIFADTPTGPAHADWPPIPFGMTSRFFLHGGTVEDDALDFINAAKITIPSVARDRTFPKYFQIRLANTGGRGITSELRGKQLYWGMLGRCRDTVDTPDQGRVVGAYKQPRIPTGALCVPLWARFRSQDPYYFSPEPPAPRGLAIDASDPGAIRLTWEPVPGAKGYVVELTDDLTWATRDSECVVFRPEEIFYNLPSRPWAARVKATNEGGAGPWSDGIRFTPGATREGVAGLAVVATSPASITWGWEAPEGTDTCEVEWDGLTSGSVEVSRGEQELWRYTIGELEPGTTVSLRVRSLGPEMVWDLWSDWVPGTAGVAGAPEVPRNLRVTHRDPARVDCEWDMPSGLTMSQIQARFGAETAFRFPIPVVSRAGRSTASIPADPGTTLAVQVRSALDFGSGPYSAWIPTPPLATGTTTGLAKPPTITDLRASPEIGHVLFSWTQPDEVIRAHLEWTETPPGSSVRGPARQVSLGDGGERAVYAPRGTVIRARVRASHSSRLDLSGNVVGDWSEWVEGTVPASIPVPTGLGATAGAGTVRFDWVLPAGIRTAEIAVEQSVRPDPLSGTTFGSARRSLPYRHYTTTAGDNAYVRGRVRSITADGHRSAWSDWTAYVQPTTRRDTGGDPGEVPAVPSLEVVTTINSLEATIGIAAGATSYERAQGKSDGTWTDPITTTRTFTVTTDGDGEPLEGGEAYGLRVRAINSTGHSAWTTGSYTTLLPTPETPTVSATPSTTSVEFTVSEEDYATRVEYQREAAGGWPTAWETAATNTFSVTGLTAGTAYRYRFRSCNTACSLPRVVSFSTASIPVGPPPVPTAPGQVPSVTISGATAASFHVTYGAARGATAHWSRHRKGTGAWSSWVRRGGAGGGTFTISGLDASSTYTVEVQGRNSAGSGDGRSASATTSAPPVVCPTDRPTASGTTTSSTATITTSPPTRATRLRLRWRQSGGTYGAWATVSSPHTIRSLTANTTYNIQVRGWNAACGTNPATSSSDGGPVRTINVTTDEAPAGPVTRAPSVSWVTSSNQADYAVGAVPNAAYYQYNWAGQTTWHRFSGRNLQVPNLAAGRNYRVRFRGVNPAHVPGPASPFANAWTNPAPPAVTASTIDEKRVRFVVAASRGASSYQTRYRKAGDANWTTWSSTTAPPTVTLTGLDPNTQYMFQATATNPGGASGITSRNRRTAPAVPSLTLTTPARGQIRVVIGTSAGAISYQRRHRKGTGPWSAWANVAQTTTLTGLDDSTAYTVEATATSHAGASGSRSAVATTQAAPAPAAPTGLAIVFSQAPGFPFPPDRSLRSSFRFGPGADAVEYGLRGPGIGAGSVVHVSRTATSIVRFDRGRWVNNRDYTLRARVRRESDGRWSAWASHTQRSPSS